MGRAGEVLVGWEKGGGEGGREAGKEERTGLMRKLRMTG